MSESRSHVIGRVFIVTVTIKQCAHYVIILLEWIIDDRHFNGRCLLNFAKIMATLQAE